MTDRFQVILIVLALTLFCGVLATVIAIISPEHASPFVDRLFNTFLGLFSFGAGTIFGLLGGQADRRRRQ